MPPRCKKGFNRYPPKTGNCTLKSEIPKKRVSKKKNMSSSSKKPRCKKGTRRHPPKTGVCVEKQSFSGLSDLTDFEKHRHNINRVPTLVMPSPKN
jgi:hypothetical protein